MLFYLAKPQSGGILGCFVRHCTSQPLDSSWLPGDRLRGAHGVGPLQPEFEVWFRNEASFALRRCSLFSSFTASFSNGQSRRFVEACRAFCPARYMFGYSRSPRCVPAGEVRKFFENWREGLLPHRNECTRQAGQVHRCPSCRRRRACWPRSCRARRLACAFLKKG